MFEWANEEPVQDDGDGPHAVWRCRGCWERNDLTLVATALPYQARRGDVRSEDCYLCDAVARSAGQEEAKAPWVLILIGGMVELDPHGGGSSGPQGPA